MSENIPHHQKKESMTTYIVIGAVGLVLGMISSVWI